MAEQTSAERPPTFDAYWDSINLPRPEETRGRQYAPMFDAAKRAWDARQPEIDRLRARTEAALLRHGQHDDECRTVNENVAATACDCSLRRVIREALDG